MNISSLAMVSFLLLSGPQSGPEAVALGPPHQPAQLLAKNTDAPDEAMLENVRPDHHDEASPPESSRATSPRRHEVNYPNPGANALDGTGPNAPRNENVCCLTEDVTSLIDEVDVAAGVPGLLMELQTQLRDRDGNPMVDRSGNPVMVEVTEGLTVVEDQVLGKIDDRLPQVQKEVAEYKMKVAEKEANKQIEVEWAQAARDVAYAKVLMSQDTNKREPNSVPEMEMIELKLNHKQYVLQVDKARYDLEIKSIEKQVQEAEMKAADVQIKMRRVLAPFNGIIVEVYAEEGEWLPEGTPVLRIIRLDQLEIKGYVDANRYSPKMLENRPVTVTAPMAGGRQGTFQGKVVFASPDITSGNKFTVNIEVENRKDEEGYWQLLPGRKVRADIHLDQPKVTETNRIIPPAS